ncbi:hypothetical protein F5880DRAFT_1597213 [Lentinula raphanica]|nr:hypothetical protein F5880DRAFT_1597213 [Lentinula raphanica]
MISRGGQCNEAACQHCSMLQVYMLSLAILITSMYTQILLPMQSRHIFLCTAAVFAALFFIH